MAIQKFTCRYCGRSYIAERSTIGFVKSSFNQHQSVCKKRTPMQRVDANKKDEERWRTTRPRCIIKNDWNHEGLQTLFGTLVKSIIKKGRSKLCM